MLKELSIFQETFTFYYSSKSFDLSESENIGTEDEGSIKWIKGIRATGPVARYHEKLASLISFTKVVVT